MYNDDLDFFSHLNEEDEETDDEKTPKFDGFSGEDDDFAAPIDVDDEDENWIYENGNKPMRDVDNDEIRQMQKDGVIKTEQSSENMDDFMMTVKPSEETQKGTLELIDGIQLAKSIQGGEESAAQEKEVKHIREYKNKAQMEKVIFRKPKEIGGGGLKKVLIFLLVCVGAGLLFGVKANSYFIAKNGKVESAFACSYLWLTEDSIPTTIIPLNSGAFGSGFMIGFGVLAVIGLFIYLENDTKKQSRVGHEHGAAHLGTPSDFKAFKKQFMENNDNNMLFGKYKGEELGLSLNNKKVNRSANVLVIGGTGTGKTFKYIKPNLLQENCSVVVTDPSGDIFRSFAPYLLSKGYNVYLFNASDFTLSNHYNPLLNVYNSNNEIQETQVDVLVDLYMKNAKAGKEASGGDPFWDKAEKAFLTALIYYVLENDDIPRQEKCFATILKKVQMAKVDDDTDEESPLTQEMNAWFKKMDEANKTYKAKLYYDTFLIAPQKTANTILITTAVDLQIFSTHEVDFITREDEEHPEMNINIDKMATQQSYLFLGIPQSHQAYNFLIAMLYSQLYGRLYELGERKLRGKYHIGYKPGCPVFDYFDSEEEAEEFYCTVTKDNIIEKDYINGTQIYNITWKGKPYKSSVLKEPLEKFIDEIEKMCIWAGDDFAGGDPALPIHINFLLDEFKNIGEIPNFLTILSTSRKYRIGSHCVIQDIGQIKTLYKDGEHETLMANVDTVIFLGSNLKEDKEEIQKMLGKTTIRQKSTSSSNSGLSTSYTPTEVDLMSLDEIGAINQNGRDDELVIIRDVTPYLCRKLNLTEHKRWNDVKAVKELKIDVEKYYRNNNKNDMYG